MYTSNLLFFVTALLPMSRNHDSLQIPDMSKCLLTDTKSHLPRERRCKKHIIRQVSITIKSMKKGFHSFCNGSILINKSFYILREYGSSGEDVSVNAVIIPKNWWAIPSEGRSPEEGYCSQFWGMMTAFTDTSDPELLYSHCWQVKTRVFNLVKNQVLVFLGGL